MAWQAGFDFGERENSNGQAGFDFGRAGFTRVDDFAEQARRAQERQDRLRQERAEQARREQERQERERRRREQSRQSYRHAGVNDPWRDLGVQAGATQAEIRAAWLALVKKHHPDHGGDAASFRVVQAAYEALRRRSS